LNKAGTYNITYKVTDYLGASVEKTVTMTVANNQAPTIATTEATVYASSATPKDDVLKQIKYNDAEDGQNVKLSNDNKVDITFIDANGNVVDPADANFYKKVAKAYVINVTDSNGAYAQTKLIDIKVADGIVLTAKDQSVDVDIKAPATTTIDPMQFITATLNGAAYTLDNPATTQGGNTTVTIKNGEGKEVPSISVKEAGTYTVTYTVTDKDTKLTATKTITVKVVDKDAEAKAAKDKAVSDAIKAIQAIQLGDADHPVKTADLQAQVDTAQKAYDAVKALDDPALLSKISTKKLDDAKKELQKKADADKAANDAELAQKAEAESAIKYAVANPSQGTNYTYQCKFNVSGTDVTATGNVSNYLDTKDGAVADLAQFLGGLYKSGKVTGIIFNGSTYTWNQNGTLKGSNWTNF
jgi:PKD repeat protein